MAGYPFQANGQDDILFDNFQDATALISNNGGMDYEWVDIFFDPTSNNPSPMFGNLLGSPDYNTMNWQQPAVSPNPLITQFLPQAPSLNLTVPTTGASMQLMESPVDMTYSPGTDVSPSSASPALPATPKSEIPVKRRLPQLKGGYKCDVIGCTKVCDRNGDLQKHKKRTHTPEEQRAHGCPHCKKRFLWRKDLIRHKRQVHSGRSASSSSSSSASSRHSPSALIQAGGFPKLTLKMLSGTTGGKPARVGSIDEVINLLLNTIRTRRVAIRLRARRRSSLLASAAEAAQDAARRFVLVTDNGRDFRAVDISTGAANAKALSRVLRAALEFEDEAATMPLPLTPFALGRGKTGTPLAPNELYDMIFPSASATPNPAVGSLQFFLDAPMGGRVVEDDGVF